MATESILSEMSLNDISNLSVFQLPTTIHDTQVSDPTKSPGLLPHFFGLLKETALTANGVFDDRKEWNRAQALSDAPECNIETRKVKGNKN